MKRTHDAKEIEGRIMELFVNNSYIEADEDDDVLFPDVEEVETFEEASVCTNDRGLKIYLEDGTVVYLTIQVYK